MSIQSEAQSLSPTARIDLFVLDLSQHNAGALYFCSTSNPLGGDVVWQGVTYTAMPISSSGFEKRTNGTLPTPHIRVSNYQGLLGALAKEYGDLEGCRVVRKRTFVKYLDAVNFPGGNPTADPNQYFPDETWVVKRKSSEDAESIEFELGATIDVPGVMLPLRQCRNSACAWLYRGESCNYAGGPVAQADGTPTTDPQLDKCGKKLSDCELRHNVQRYGAFPGSGRIR